MSLMIKQNPSEKFQTTLIYKQIRWLSVFGFQNTIFLWWVPLDKGKSTYCKLISVNSTLSNILKIFDVFCIIIYSIILPYI
jgi:hypothetical protein